MKCELLAPAGSYESAVAAINAGADAIYIGGTRFGARAYAENPEEDRLVELLDYAHLHGKRVFLTVNTLLKNRELDELFDWLKPLYEAGLDAVIVQDLGVIRCIRRWFPQMEVHASTQLTTNGSAWFEELKALGCTRVVLSREVSAAEIQKIREKTDLEIESFIHGALCYCYSGQCLFSSLIGGRSGNRGRCAQPCRLPYEYLAQEKGGETSFGKQYWMSLKDMETLRLLPEILDAGVFSLKIEGRMKRPEYTAGVVSVYRKYIDLYEKKGRKGYRVEEDDIRILKDLYNRGGFCEGYYKKHNSADMLSLKRPNHQGTEALRIESVKGNQAVGVTLEQISKKDRLETWDGKNVSVTGNVPNENKIPAGKKLNLSVARGTSLRKGEVLIRTQNAELLQHLQTFLTAEPKIPVDAEIIVHAGIPVRLKVRSGKEEVILQGDVPDFSMNRPLTPEILEKQMKKTGGSSFEMRKVIMDLEDGLFLPLPSLNKIRRDALEQLKEKRLAAQRRTAEVCETEKGKNRTAEKGSTSPKIVCLCNTDSQVYACASAEAVSALYLETNLLLRNTDPDRLVADLKAKGKQVYLAMPHIFRSEKENANRKALERLLGLVDGVLVRNMESYAFVKERNESLPVVTDSSLYTMNREAIAFWEEKGIERRVFSLELNEKELAGIGGKGTELMVYGRPVTMLSAQCFRKTAGICRKQEGSGFLKDRKGKKFPVQNICSFCYNIIYNCDILDLRSETQAISSIRPDAVRFSFLEESKEEVRSILGEYVTCRENGKNSLPDGYTRGHFRRGVE